MRFVRNSSLSSCVGTVRRAQSIACPILHVWVSSDHVLHGLKSCDDRFAIKRMRSDCLPHVENDFPFNTRCCSGSFVGVHMCAASVDFWLQAKDIALHCWIHDD